MATVFISYSRRDIEFAERLTAGLKKSDLDFWIERACSLLAGRKISPLDWNRYFPGEQYLDTCISASL